MEKFRCTKFFRYRYLRLKDKEMDEQNFEQFVLCDEKKLERIRAVLDRYELNLYPEVENEEIGEDNDDEWKNFDIRNYL